MAFNILQAPFVRPILNGFQCHPKLGTMQIPQILRKATVQKDYQVRVCPVAPTDFDLGKRLLDVLAPAANTLCGPKGFALLPGTHSTWRLDTDIASEDAGSLRFRYLGYKRRPVNDIELHWTDRCLDISMGFVGAQRSAKMIMLLHQAPPHSYLDNTLYYEFSMLDYSLAGLRRYLRLPPVVDIETVRAALLLKLGVREAANQMFYPEANPALREVVRWRKQAARRGDTYGVHMPPAMIRADLIGHVGDSQVRVIAGIEAGEEGKAKAGTEQLTLEIMPRDLLGNDSQPLCASARGLWQWCVQDQPSPSSEDKRLYQQRLATIYPTTAPTGRF